MNNQTTTIDNDILLDIPEHIWQQCASYKECPEGWWNTAKKVEAVLLAEGILIRQMKEKFGGLRVYWDWPEEWNDLEDETFHDKCEQIECLIDIADWVCQRTCMVCGEKGTLRNESWVSVLCEGHYNEWRERVYGKKGNEAKR